MPTTNAALCGLVRLRRPSRPHTLPRVTFDANALRLERFQVEVGYPAAFRFWTFKGVLADKYAHGPKFGAYADLGNQVKLTPKDGFAEDQAEVTYGIKGASFDQEQVADHERSRNEARQWFEDVLQVLEPKKITRVRAHWFALYPIGNEDAARSKSQKIRLHYYDKDKLDAIQPDYGSRHAAIDTLCIDGDKKWSVVIGAVGPPHRNVYFGVPDRERDRKWWMGLNFNLARENDDGLAEDGVALSGTIKELIDEGATEYMRLIDVGLKPVV